MASIPFGRVKIAVQLLIFIVGAKPDGPRALDLIGHQFRQPSYPQRRELLEFVKCHKKSRKNELKYSTIALLDWARKNCQLTSLVFLYFRRCLSYISRSTCKYFGSVSTVIQIWWASANLRLCLSVGTRRCSPWENQWCTVVTEQSQMNASSSRDTFQTFKNSSTSIRSPLTGRRYASNAFQCRWVGVRGASVIVKLIVGWQSSRYHIFLGDRTYVLSTYNSLYKLLHHEPKNDSVSFGCSRAESENNLAVDCREKYSAN